MMRVPYMAHDERPIATLSGAGDYWSVGRCAVTRIVPYYENIEGMLALWFAIYEGDRLAYRVPVSAVEYVWYGKAGAGKGAT